MNQNAKYQNRGNGANQAGQKNPGAQKPAQEPPRKILDHPEDNLQISAGVVASIRSNYHFSAQALETLRRHFAHLFIGGDNSRFYVGDKQGFKNHPHALGAFLRSYFDDLVMYKYQPRGTMLDIGASPIRSLGRYYTNVEGVRRPWLSRLHIMTPRLDMRDDVREQDHFWSMQAMSEKHNAIEDAKLLADPGYRQFKYTVDDDCSLSLYQCNHKLTDVDDPNCDCGKEYDALKLIESWYYPGVLENTIRRLCKAYKNCKRKGVGWIVGNDYYRMLLRRAKTDPNMLKTVFEREVGEHPFLDVIGKGCVGTDGNPESIHRITSPKGKLFVDAHVKGNPTNYQHHIPRTADADTFIAHVTHDGTDFVVLFEKKEEVVNGEVPFVLYKLNVTEKERWSAEALAAQVEVKLGEAEAVHLLCDSDPEIFSSWGSESTEVTEVESPKSPSEKVEEVPISIFDEEVYAKKVVQKSDKKLCPEKMKQHQARIGFVRWIQNQFSNSTHSFYLRYNNGEASLLVRRRHRAVFGMFLSESRDLTALAPLDAVLKAYIELGIKSSATAIHQAMVNSQRESTSKGGVSAKLLLDQEAFAIARLLRLMETKRFALMIDGYN